jgi:hypothetical protein
MQLISCMLVGVTGFEPATSTSQTRRAPVVLESKSVPGSKLTGLSKLEFCRL